MNSSSCTKSSLIMLLFFLKIAIPSNCVSTDSNSSLVWTSDKSARGPFQQHRLQRDLQCYEAFHGVDVATNTVIWKSAVLSNHSSRLLLAITTRFCSWTDPKTTENEVPLKSTIGKTARLQQGFSYLQLEAYLPAGWPHAQAGLQSWPAHCVASSSPTRNWLPDGLRVPISQDLGGTRRKARAVWAFLRTNRGICRMEGEQALGILTQKCDWFWQPRHELRHQPNIQPSVYGVLQKQAVNDDNQRVCHVVISGVHSISQKGVT